MLLNHGHGGGGGSIPDRALKKRAVVAWTRKKKAFYGKLLHTDLPSDHKTTPFEAKQWSEPNAAFTQMTFTLQT